ncbi:MAG: hypothetical protein QNJ94_23595 [Alphaproteobacteria bacterium]|nr:hypothetical protein [Alphaproteobacteria bacterium]
MRVLQAGLAAGLILVAAGLVGPVSVAAEVDVLRGKTPAQTDVVVLRGRGAAPVEPEFEEEEEAKGGIEFVGGNRAWYIDYGDQTITACRLEEGTDFGDGEVRCFENDLFPEPSLRVTKD